MVECLRVARYSGKALVDSSRDVVGDPRRVVGLLADVERVVGFVYAPGFTQHYASSL